MLVTTDEALRRRPAENSWSAAECIEHLSVATETYVRRIRRALETARRRAPRKKEKLSFVGSIYIRFMEPPVRRRLPAPKGLMPGAVAENRDALLARFDQTHRALIELIEETDAFDRTGIKLRSPIRLIKVSLLDSFALLAAHDRRHLWQAERAARS